MLDTDRHFFERCMDKHPDDFRHLVGRDQRPLLAHLGRRLGRNVQAEEAAQPSCVAFAACGTPYRMD